MLLIKFLHVSQKQDMTIPNWDFGISPKGLEWRCQNMENPLFLDSFWRILKYSKEENTPKIKNIEKLIYSIFYLLNKLDNFVLKKFFPILLHLGDSQF
jgi:hypothetical protein